MHFAGHFAFMLPFYSFLKQAIPGFLTVRSQKSKVSPDPMETLITAAMPIYSTYFVTMLFTTFTLEHEYSLICLISGVTLNLIYFNN
jgi:hypothetical protein